MNLIEAVQTIRDEVADLIRENERLRIALQFYADPANYMDTPSWDSDPDCITPKAIPMTIEEYSIVCDCGDIARAALGQERRT